MIISDTISLTAVSESTGGCRLNTEWLVQLLDDNIRAENFHSSDMYAATVLAVKVAWRALRDAQARIAVYIDEAEMDVEMNVALNKITIRASSAFFKERSVFIRIVKEGGEIVTYESLTSCTPMMELETLDDLQRPYIDYAAQRDAMSMRMPECLIKEVVV